MAKKKQRSSRPKSSKSKAPTKHRAKSARPAAKRPAKSHTPLFRAYLAITLDGYIADKNGGVDFLNNFMSPEIDFGGFMSTIGATVYGRTTFDWAVSHGFFGEGGRAVVLTRRPLSDPPRGVEAFNGDVRELAQRLRAELAGTGKDIWLMGGGLSIAPFHEAGLVDRWELSIIPVTLGDGIPLFPKHSRGLSGLQLTHSRALKNGIVVAHYEPARA
jgi:dihydrofolate reductase